MTSLSRLPARLLTVFAFILVTVLGFGYMWVQSGGSLPGITKSDYRVVFYAKDIKNLENSGDVRMAGVRVGSVADRTNTPQGARVVLDLSREVAPLHEGATIRVGMKSVVGMSQVDIDDGDGAELPSGSTLPAKAVEPAVDIDEVIATLDPETRKALSGTLRSLGTATRGSKDNISKLLSGMGHLGREGHVALDALAAQTDDLKALTRQASTIMRALDTGRGRIANVVRNTQRITRATSGQREALESTMRAMPALLDNAKTATADLSELSQSLAPVAEDLTNAAPALNKALLQLPAVSRDLRDLLPSLDSALDAAPATLERVPAVGADARALIPEARALLKDVNPMLAYLKPYGTDIGAFFPNFGSSFDLLMDNGVRAVRLTPIFNQGSLRNIPFTALSELDPTTWANPYPKPGSAASPEPFTGKYPRVERGDG
ncbi:MlaD family protein [Haloechinothrix salitolerans]|uniref:MlaD family protein n=1 Tax=Haloechinothrix salitolerans TaxID=926830 RepID=A0ABW2C2V2_9PSEU